MLRLSLLFVGTTHCGNCVNFKPEWQKLKDGVKNGEILDIPGYQISLEEYIVSSHDSLPSSIANTVTFYPFLMLLPTEYLERNLNNPDENFVLVGEAMYTYRSMNNGKLSYRLGSSVNDSPNMRYPRTAEGIENWVRDSAIKALQVLSVKYYENIEFPNTDSRRTKMQALPIRKDERMEMFIPPLNKEYRVVSGGLVMCRRVLNVHS